MKLEIEKKYNSELIAITDLHGGGIFFCLVYIKVLTFKTDGEVVLTKKVINPFRPMDPIDIALIDNFKIKGKYHTNDNDYITCEFDEIYLKLIGIHLEKNPSTLVFNAYDSRLKTQWSEIYKIEQ
jgi:hypothetical protein